MKRLIFLSIVIFIVHESVGKEITTSSDVNVKYFIEAAMQGDLSTMDSLKGIVDINAGYKDPITVTVKKYHQTIEFGKNALMAILSMQFPPDNKETIIKWLMENGADSNAQAQQTLWTPLMFAIVRAHRYSEKNYEFLRKFIKNYRDIIDLTIKNIERKTTYDMAEKIKGFPEDLKQALNPTPISVSESTIAQALTALNDALNKLNVTLR